MNIWENEKLDWDTFAAFISNPSNKYLFEQEARYIIIPKEKYLSGGMCELMLYERRFKHTNDLENLSPKELMDHSFHKLGSIRWFNPFNTIEERFVYKIICKTERELTIAFTMVLDGRTEERTYSMTEVEEGNAQAFPAIG